jgi:hypothetical protein
MRQLFGVAPGVAPVNTYIKDGGVSGGPSFVELMQPADLGQRHDSPSGSVRGGYHASDTPTGISNPP